MLRHMPCNPTTSLLPLTCTIASLMIGVSVALWTYFRDVLTEISLYAPNKDTPIHPVRVVFPDLSMVTKACILGCGQEASWSLQRADLQRVKSLALFSIMWWPWPAIVPMKGEGGGGHSNMSCTCTRDRGQDS